MSLYKEKPPQGTVGIVIPMRDNLKYFKLAFHSVLSFTDVPFVLTVVDNMSTFTTRQYLSNLQKRHKIHVLHYQEDFNYGSEVNLAMHHMFKNNAIDYGLCLNSDTVVEESWLSRLLSSFTIFPKCGIVGPVSNIAIPAQQVKKASALYNPEYVSGFCMIFRRKVFDQLNGFDERYVGGCYEDQDFCVRARARGWQIIINTSVYIHHFWRATRNLDVNANENVELNRKRFVEKFSKSGNFQDELNRATV